MNINIAEVRDMDQELHDALLERVTDDSDTPEVREAALEEWCKTHTPADALAEWFGWNFGDPSWGSTVMSKIWCLVQADQTYLTKTDQDTELLFREMLGRTK